MHSFNFNALSEKTIIFVGIYNQQIQGTLLLMVESTFRVKKITLPETHRESLHLKIGNELFKREPDRLSLPPFFRDYDHHFITIIPLKLTYIKPQQSDDSRLNIASSCLCVLVYAKRPI